MEVYFPINDVQQLVEYVHAELSQPAGGVDYVRLSLVLGMVEHSLSEDGPPGADRRIAVDLDTISQIHLEFLNFLKFFERSLPPITGSLSAVITCGPNVVSKPCDSLGTSKSFISLVEKSLREKFCTQGIKDKPHANSLYSLSLWQFLNSYGLAYAIFCACHVLGRRDVFMAFSESQTWLVHGENSRNYYFIEKPSGAANRVSIDEDMWTSWSFLGGRPVVAAEPGLVVASMAMVMGTETEALELARTHLLQDFFCHGFLDKYPMSLTLLANSMCDDDKCSDKTIASMMSRISIYEKAIASAQHHYADRMVYPYVCFGWFWKDLGHWRKACAFWRRGAAVLRRYQYVSLDDEMCGEMLRIIEELVGCFKAKPQLRDDAEMFADIVVFYDSVYQWVENSGTRVLHTAWVTWLMKLLVGFSPQTRSRVTILRHGDVTTTSHSDAGDGALMSLGNNSNSNISFLQHPGANMKREFADEKDYLEDDASDHFKFDQLLLDVVDQVLGLDGDSLDRMLAERHLNNSSFPDVFLEQLNERPLYLLPSVSQLAGIQLDAGCGESKISNYSGAAASDQGSNHLPNLTFESEDISQYLCLSQPFRNRMLVDSAVSPPEELSGSTGHHHATWTVIVKSRKFCAIKDLLVAVKPDVASIKLQLEGCATEETSRANGRVRRVVDESVDRSSDGKRRKIVGKIPEIFL